MTSSKIQLPCCIGGKSDNGMFHFLFSNFRVKSHKEVSIHIVVKYLFNMATLHIFNNVILRRYKRTVFVVFLSFAIKTFRPKL